MSHGSLSVSQPLLFCFVERINIFVVDQYIFLDDTSVIHNFPEVNVQGYCTSFVLYFLFDCDDTRKSYN